jgi:hypothetical protein
MQGAERGSILISLMQLDDSGNVVMLNEVETDMLSVLPQGGATIVQDGSEIN